MLFVGRYPKLSRYVMPGVTAVSVVCSISIAVSAVEVSNPVAPNA